MMFVLPTGAFDPKRHADSLAAAQAELSEEVRVSEEPPAATCSRLQLQPDFCSCSPSAIK